jgi:16S rRNA (adenine1518-N6/adenine1519-N6)-dimethyltransferase
MKYPQANKDLGQHFLKDQNVINKITELPDEDVDVILEIGPGPGVLSENLTKLNRPYKVIEADRRFHEYLISHLPEENIIFADALEFDLEEAFKIWGWEDKKIWLVSNLPYNISAPLTIKFLQQREISYMSLMYQREVASKILGDGKKNEQGSLLVLCQNFFDVESLCKVAKGAFNPPPKVESQVLSYYRKNEVEVALEEFSEFESFLRKLFSFKRKQLGTVLKNYFPKDKIDNVLNLTAIDVKIRAEALSLEQVYRLYRNFK